MLRPDGIACPICGSWFVVSIAGAYVCPHQCDTFHRNVMMGWRLR